MAKDKLKVTEFVETVENEVEVAEFVETVENEVIEKDGMFYTVVTLSTKEKVEFKHPKGLEIRRAMVTLKRDADLPFLVISDATCKTMEEIDELPAKDLMKLLRVATGFLL